MGGCPRPFVRSGLVLPPSLPENWVTSFTGDWVDFAQEAVFNFEFERQIDWVNYDPLAWLFELDGVPVAPILVDFGVMPPWTATFVVPGVLASPLTWQATYSVPPGLLVGPLAVPLPAFVATDPMV